MITPSGLSILKHLSDIGKNSNRRINSRTRGASLWLDDATSLTRGAASMASAWR